MTKTDCLQWLARGCRDLRLTCEGKLYLLEDFRFTTLDESVSDICNRTEQLHYAEEMQAEDLTFKVELSKYLCKESLWEVDPKKSEDFWLIMNSTVLVYYEGADQEKVTQICAEWHNIRDYLMIKTNLAPDQVLEEKNFASIHKNYRSSSKKSGSKGSNENKGLLEITSGRE